MAKAGTKRKAPGATVTLRITLVADDGAPLVTERVFTDADAFSGFDRRGKVVTVEVLAIDVPGPLDLTTGQPLLTGA